MSHEQVVDNFDELNSSNIKKKENDMKCEFTKDISYKIQSGANTTLVSSSVMSSPPPQLVTKASVLNRHGSKKISFKALDDGNEKKSQIRTSDNNLSDVNENRMKSIEKDIDLDDGENYRIRRFNTTKKGTIINRGDSFKTSFRRSVRVPNVKSISIASSNSTSKIDKLDSSSNDYTNELNKKIIISNSDDKNENTAKLEEICYLNSPRLYSMPSTFDTCNYIETFFVCMLGATSVGKSALVKQFETSEYRGIYQMRPSITPHNLTDEDNSEPISIMLDGIESHIYFKSVDIDLVKPDMNLIDKTNLIKDIDGYIVVYAITDKESFQKASEILDNLIFFEKTDLPIILVGNKSDLARKRFITREEGKAVARKKGCKFVETSVAIHDKVDDLLAGILKQIRLNKSNVFIEANNSAKNPTINQEFEITNMRSSKEYIKNDINTDTKKTKHLSLIKNTSFFKKLFKNVFKSKSSLKGDSVENLFSPVSSHE